jgi:hypothetical protein
MCIVFVKVVAVDCILIVLIMYGFLPSLVCIGIGLMYMFIVNACHIKCRGLLVHNGEILLKKEQILHPRGICCQIVTTLVVIKDVYL